LFVFALLNSAYSNDLFSSFFRKSRQVYVVAPEKTWNYLKSTSLLRAFLELITLRKPSPYSAVKNLDGNMYPSTPPGFNSLSACSTNKQ